MSSQWPPNQKSVSRRLAAAPTALHSCGPFFNVSRSQCCAVLPDVPPPSVRRRLEEGALYFADHQVERVDVNQL